MHQKKVLIIATKGGFIAQFEIANILYLQQLGYEVHCAINLALPNYYSENLEMVDVKLHQVDFVRTPASKNNIHAYKQLLKLMKTHKFSLIHCHNPVSGALGRLAAKKTGTSPVIYTAHGFHFFKGAPLSNWISYYPIEKYLSKYTDALITINDEDFTLAKTKMKAKRVYKVPGVGLDLERFNNLKNIAELKKELKIKDNTTVILSVGEMNHNKNHITVINALKNLKTRNFVYLVCGLGSEHDKVMMAAEKAGLANNVMLLGFRSDIIEINKISDIFVFPSYREGLSVALMEAMQSGKPVICSKIRGNTDLIENYKGGFLIEPDDSRALTEHLEDLIENKKLCKSMGEYNIKKVKDFSTDIVSPIMKSIYDTVLGNKNE